MKLNSNMFKKAVKIAEKISKGCPSEPIPVRIAVEDNFFYFQTTNLSQTFTKKIYTDSSDNFEVFANINDLKKICKTLKKEFALSFETEKMSEISTISKLVFTEKNVVKIIVKTREDDAVMFPEAISGQLEDQKEFSIPPNEDKFFSLIKKILFSTTKHSVNRSYAGIFFDSDHQGLCSTDIHRLSFVKYEDIKIPIDVVVDAEFLEMMIKNRSGDFIKMSANKDYTIFSYSDETWIGHNIKPEFPNYMSVIGENYGDEEDLSIDKNLFEEKLKDMSDIFDKTTPATLTFGSENIKMNSRDSAGTEMTAEIPFVNTSLPEIKRGYNIRYLLDVMKSCEKDKIEINYGCDERLKPLTVKERGDGFIYVHLVMPCRI